MVVETGPAIKLPASMTFKPFNNKLVERSYEKGKAIEAAAHLEIDAVIDPADTRKVILKALKNKFI